MTKILERIKFVKEIIKDKQEEYDFLIETDKESANYILTDMKLYEEILKDLEENEILKQSVKDTFDSSQDIISEISEERDLFKLAFYSLWKCCNSRNTIIDFENTDYYIEFKVGYDSVYVGVSLEEIESIEKACKLLDIKYCEVEDE